MRKGEKLFVRLLSKDEGLVKLFNDVKRLIKESGVSAEDLLELRRFLYNMKDLPIFLFNDPDCRVVRNEDDWVRVVIIIDSFLNLMRVNIFTEKEN